MKHSKQRHKQNGKVITEHVNELAWQTALSLANGDVRRLQVVNTKTVIVRNKPRQPLQR